MKIRILFVLLLSNLFVTACSSGGSDSGDNTDNDTGGENEDIDFDGIVNTLDNCPMDANASQLDTDEDGLGGSCDDSTIFDDDRDGTEDQLDNCVIINNPRQEDTDGDGRGDACDDTPLGPDDDRDGVPNSSDNCRTIENTEQTDADQNGTGDICDAGPTGDLDADGIVNSIDVDQTGGSDSNSNGVDDMEEQDVVDDDFDGVANSFDNCPFDSNPGQEDSNFDNVGDVCRIAVFGACGNEGGSDPGLQFSTSFDWSDNCHVSARGEWAKSGYTLGIQSVLSCLGYDLITDGIFGPETEAKVADFQLGYGVADTGIVDNDTWTLLQIELIFVERSSDRYETYAPGSCFTDIAFDWDFEDIEWEIKTIQPALSPDQTNWFQFSVKPVQFLR